MRIFYFLYVGSLTVSQLFRALHDGLDDLRKFTDQRSFERILDCVDEQKRIGDIFERINGARIQFEVGVISFNSLT